MVAVNNGHQLKSTELFLIKTSDTQPFPLICSWTDLPSSSTTMLAHAFCSPRKVTESGHALSCLHLLKFAFAFYPCPPFTCPNIMVDEVTTFQDGILLKTLAAPLMLPHFAYMSTKLLPTKTSDSQPLGLKCS
jgi:hypothetical protein